MRWLRGAPPAGGQGQGPERSSLPRTLMKPASDWLFRKRPHLREWALRLRQVIRGWSPLCVTVPVPLPPASNRTDCRGFFEPATKHFPSAATSATSRARNRSRTASQLLKLVAMMMRQLDQSVDRRSPNSRRPGARHRACHYRRGGLQLRRPDLTGSLMDDPSRGPPISRVELDHTVTADGRGSARRQGRGQAAARSTPCTSPRRRRLERVRRKHIDICCGGSVAGD